MYAILALALFAAAPAAEAVATPPAPVAIDVATTSPTIDAVELRLALRDLWTNHVFWIRSYVVEEADGRLGTTDVTADLELEVPVDTQAGEYTGALTVSLFPVD